MSTAYTEAGPNTTHLLTDPVELETIVADGQTLEATRHLFLAADLMDPERSREIGMPQGGEEMAANRCLRRTEGRIPRCMITPLEFSAEWMPKDLFPEGMEQYALVPKGIKAEDTGGRIFKPLLGYPYYPGHMITDATGLTGRRRGIVEIENLRGVDYGGGDREMQALFFPPDYRLPIEIDLVREHIERTAEGVADPTAKDTAGFLVTSCLQSREYMEQLVSIANTQLDARVTGQFIHRLTPKIRHFMAQLGIKPRSEPVVAVQEAVDSALNKALGPNILVQLQSQNADMVNAIVSSIGPAIGAAVQQAITAALEANKAVKPVKS
jgi:hypothetical protein